MPKGTSLVSMERIERAIYLIRGHKIMLDRDLAELYGVSTKVLNQAVKRHKERFPADFMFQLTMQEARRTWAEISADRLRSQVVTLKRGNITNSCLMFLPKMKWLCFHFHQRPAESGL